MFFSPSTNGFYGSDIHGSNIPNDAVEITLEEHAALLAAQAEGKTIVFDEQIGKPVAVTPAPPSLAEVKAALLADIDDHISGIYNRFTRFAQEYEQREAAARAFADGGYQGEPGVWVSAFAVNSGNSNAAAADIILAQAAQLRTALENLGAQRMRKYGVLAAANSAAAQALYDDIIDEADAIAETLS